jgi:pimeloyl-ACP methyl ester carboxylesterase
VPIRRPKGVIGKALFCVRSDWARRSEHVSTEQEFPDGVVRRIAFEAGGGLKWTISALATPRETPAPWKIVVITGAPSWAEYWSPALAAQPADREMIVVDRPGYGASEPHTPVRDIRIQAEALAPLLDAPRGQKVLLVGQSYGAAIAAVMAANAPKKVHGLVLLSGYFGEPGPTAKWLLDAGHAMSWAIPRDLRTAVEEVRSQPAQLAHARAGLDRLKTPVHVIHGDKDDFAPLDIAERIAGDIRARRLVRFQRVEGADHFMVEGRLDALLEAIEACIPKNWEAPRRDWRDHFVGAIAVGIGAAAWSGDQIWRWLGGLTPAPRRRRLAAD